MPEPFTIISLIAAAKTAITGWLANKGADFVKDKATGFAGEKVKEFSKNQLARFRENARLHLRQPDQSIPKALRLAYLQATLQVCALQSDELGTNVTSYSQYVRNKLPRWKREHDEPLGILSLADLQWLDRLHQWLRAEIDNVRKDNLPPLEITEQDFADLVPFENDIDDKPLRKRLTEHLISEIERVCPEMPDTFGSLLIEGWFQFDVYEQARRITWFDCFCVCFQQALMKDPPAREFFQTKLLAGIAHQQRPIDFDQFAVALRRLNEQLAARDISIYFDELSLQMDKGFVALHDHLDIAVRKVDRVADRIEESTRRIIDAQTEQTETLLDAFLRGAATAEHQPPPSQASSQHGEKRGQKAVRQGEFRAFNLPYLRNEYFTGREDILQALEDGFKGGGLVQAISGMGGIGKTQTAQEYVYQHRGSYKTILWVKATTREMLTADFAAMAEALALPEKNAQDQSEAVTAVKRWLENNDGWLLILDNADDLALAREFIPVGGKGHILLTTRAHATGTIATRHSLEKMSLQEGALFLLRRSKKIAAGEPLDSASAELRSQAENLANELDGLPLALDQAAAYIEEKPTSIGRYTELYRSMGTKLRARRGDLSADHPKSVSVTFSLAFEKVAGDSAVAADLLRCCALLEADAIPEKIFSEGASELGEALASAAALPDGVMDAIGEAGRFSLLRYDPESRTVSIHCLVQDVLKDGMVSDDRRMWAERTVRALNGVFPNVIYSAWPLCGRLISHAQSLASLIDEYGFDFKEAGRLMDQAGCYLQERAQYAEAELLHQRALDIYEKALGPEHPATAMSLNNLAELYRAQGKYAEAEPLHQRALDIYERALGPEHPSTAMSLNNLALIYYAQGRYAVAEPLYKRALDIFEKALGPEHPATAMSLSNLALHYHKQRRYAVAEPLYKRALDIREEALGPEHPDTAMSLSNLAGLYYSQRRYAEAEPLYKRALDIREKALGPVHPSTAMTLNNLALFYGAQRRYAEAELLYQRTLDIYEKVLSPEHPSTALGINNLALLYYSQRRYAVAEPLLKRALEIREKALGPEHPDTAMSLNNLARIYYLQRRYAEAEPLLKRALDIYEKALGPEYPDTAMSLNNLARIYYSQRRYAEFCRIMWFWVRRIRLRLAMELRKGSGFAGYFADYIKTLKLWAAPFVLGGLFVFGLRKGFKEAQGDIGYAVLSVVSVAWLFLFLVYASKKEREVWEWVDQQPKIEKVPLFPTWRKWAYWGMILLPILTLCGFVVANYIERRPPNKTTPKAPANSMGLRKPSSTE